MVLFSQNDMLLKIHILIMIIMILMLYRVILLLVLILLALFYCSSLMLILLSYNPTYNLMGLIQVSCFEFVVNLLVACFGLSLLLCC